MEFYCAKDSRIKFFLRPDNRRKGANACRNYGFEKSRGEYIQWFDSDDLMVSNFLDTKIRALNEYNVDYIISKTANFLDSKFKKIISKNENYYTFLDYPITAFNYITQKVNWLTPDFMGCRELCEKIKFHESLNSAQERNFFSKLTCYSVNVRVLNEYLTLRRIHKNSIQSKVNRQNNYRVKERFNFLYFTWLDISAIKPGTEEEFYFLVRLLELDERKILFPENSQKIFCLLLKQRRIKKLFYLILYIYTYFLTGGGLIIRRRLKYCK
ncbi:hypothetical protein APR40_04705 [Salegentibacter salarius]|uniref:Glycosyltransferase 2-like domain-containing protein n=2 Tax=Salegentibacter salarius TaxID=435906 RepID=A0A2N0TQB6_9FLAO|nr:hypothetical protein BHS39_04705 [Salegentibacter salarius]PKD16914.1 hypothetical protein APR40_04705 [Salegentibacter salarius]